MIAPQPYMETSMSSTDFQQRRLSSFLSYPFVRLPSGAHPFVPTRGSHGRRAQGGSRMAVAKSFTNTERFQAIP